MDTKSPPKKPPRLTLVTRYSLLLCADWIELDEIVWKKPKRASKKIRTHSAGDLLRKIKKLNSKPNIHAGCSYELIRQYGGGVPKDGKMPKAPPKSDLDLFAIHSTYFSDHEGCTSLLSDDDEPLQRGLSREPTLRVA